MMIQKLLILSATVLFAACSSNSKGAALPQNEDITKQCLTDAEVEPIKKKLSEVLEKIQPRPTFFAEIDQCWKRTYTRDRHRIVIHRILDGKDRGQVAGATSQLSNDMNPEACAAKAHEVAMSLNSPTMNNLMAEYTKRYPLQSKDPDIGPAQWLRCDTGHLLGEKEAAFEFYDSIAALAFQVSNLLASAQNDEQCMFFAWKNEPVCFTGQSALPSAQVAHRKKFPSKVPRLEEFMLHHQANSMDSGASGATIFKTLNDSLHRLTVQVALMNTVGKKGIADLNQKTRTLEMFPLHANYAAKYLLVVKEKHPELFKTHFGPTTQNRKNILALFEKSREVHKDWVAGLKKVGFTPQDMETPLWKEFLKDEKRIFAEK